MADAPQTNEKIKRAKRVLDYTAEGYKQLKRAAGTARVAGDTKSADKLDKIADDAADVWREVGGKSEGSRGVR